MEPSRTYTVFAEARLVVRGELRTVLLGARAHLDAHPDATLLVFDDETGRAVDFDLRGTPDEILAREVPAPEPAGRGRPKLGVVSREVSLLPRHWQWLEEQPNGISASLRRLVEEARRNEPGHQRARRMRDAASRVMTAVAGDLPGYEEATRALFAKDADRFAACIAGWPADVRSHFASLVAEADRIEAGGRSVA